MQLAAEAAQFLFAFGLLLQGHFLDFQLGLAAAVLDLHLGLADDLAGLRLGVAAAQPIQQPDQTGTSTPADSTATTMMTTVTIIVPDKSTD